MRLASSRSNPDAALPSVGIVVLAYNHLSDTQECLRSLGGLEPANQRIFLADNGSTDGTSQAIRTEFPLIEIVRTEQNVGLPAGYNLGIRQAIRWGADYILLLNNDTIVAPDLLSHLIRAAEQDPHAAIFMPKVLYYDHRKVIWSAGARYRRFPPAIVSIGLGAPTTAYDAAASLAYAPSCGLLIRSAAFTRVGLFDEGYRFYYDDWDFCDRVRSAGFGIIYVPKARMWHKVSRTIRSRSAEFWHTWGASSARYYRRHGDPAALALPIHLGYIMLRESIKGNLFSMGYFLRGARLGLTTPLGSFPAAPRIEDPVEH